MKFRLTLVYFLILFIRIDICSQDRTIDSLNSLLKSAKHDTLKVAYFDEISRHYMLTQPDSSLHYWNKVIDIASQFISSDNKEERVRKAFKIHLSSAYSGIGQVYIERSDLKIAVHYISKSMILEKELGDTINAAYSLIRLGDVSYIQGDVKQAINNYNLSADLLLRKDGYAGLGVCYNNLGVIYREQGDLPKAYDFLLKGLKFRQKANYKQGIGNSYQHLGRLASEQGDDELALEHYNIALKIQEEISDYHGMSNSLSNIGSIYKTRRQYNASLNCFRRSIELSEKKGEKVYIDLSNIGNVYENMENYDEALKYYFECIEISKEIDKRTTGIVYQNIGRVYRFKNDIKKAIEYHKMAMEVALTMKSNKYYKDACRDLYFDYFKERNYDSSYKYLHILLNYRLRDVSNNYMVLSEKEKEKYFQTIEADFKHYFLFTSINKAIDPKLTEISYDISLKTKGITLNSTSAIRNSILNSSDSSLISDYTKWLELKKRITKLYESGKDYKELIDKSTVIEKQLIQKSNLFNDQKQLSDINWKKVQSYLKKDEAAIEFINFRQGIDTIKGKIYAALIVKRNSLNPEMIILCSQSELESILHVIEGSHFEYVNKVYGTKDNIQSALYDKIWKPLEKSLNNVKTVYYSPVGSLHKISFSALQVGQNRLLSDRYVLNRVGSTAAVTFTNKIEYTANDNVLLVGGVKYNSDSTKNKVWNYLPGTLSETQLIHQLLVKSQNNTQYYYSSSATEANLKDNVSQSNILHVATHGFFFQDPEIEKEKVRLENALNYKRNELLIDGNKNVSANASPDNSTTKDFPVKFRGDAIFINNGSTNYANWNFVKNKNPLMRTGLVLANANDVWSRDPLTEGEDGVLTAQEVSNLDLQKAKLVVLSACETGLGDIKGSEGVYGLQRAFKMAGAKYIIMSLWQVPDKETSEFMTTFYTKLTTCKDIEKAFHQTQKEMRKKYDPYFWAAFTLLE